jgi:hypothetical protein
MWGGEGGDGDRVSAREGDKVGVSGQRAAGDVEEAVGGLTLQETLKRWTQYAPAICVNPSTTATAACTRTHVIHSCSMDLSTNSRGTLQPSQKGT